MIDWLNIEDANWEEWYEKENMTIYKRDRKHSSYRIDAIYENTTMENILDCIIDFDKQRNWNSDSFDTI